MAGDLFLTTFNHIKRHLFFSLPSYFMVEDSNRDDQNMGTLERFLDVFSIEAANTYLETGQLPTLLNPVTCPETHLHLLGAHYGIPPTMFQLKTYYRKLLSAFSHLMGFKGTLEGLEKFFALFGVKVEVEDVTTPASIYDTLIQHDDRIRYDTENPLFFFICIKIIDPEGNFPVNPLEGGETLKRLYDLCYFMIPINVFIQCINYNGLTEVGYLLDEEGRYLLTDISEKLIPLTDGS
jgi:hypothetical protein